MAITVSYTDVAGNQPGIQALGQYRGVMRDVRMTSDAPAGAGVAVVDPGRLGMTKIFMVIDGHCAAGGTAADTPRIVDFAPATNTLSFLGNDRAALTLDAADYAQARLLFLGY